MGHVDKRSITLSWNARRGRCGWGASECTFALRVIRDALRLWKERPRPLRLFAGGVARADPAGHRQRGFGEIRVDGRALRPSSPPIRARLISGWGTPCHITAD